MRDGSIRMQLFQSFSDDLGAGRSTVWGAGREKSLCSMLTTPSSSSAELEAQARTWASLLPSCGVGSCLPHLPAELLPGCSRSRSWWAELGPQPAGCHQAHSGGLSQGLHRRNFPFCSCALKPLPPCGSPLSMRDSSEASCSGGD